jgi:hypothetical protein
MSASSIRVTCLGCSRVFMSERDFFVHAAKGPGGLRSRCRQGKRRVQVQDAVPHPGQTNVGLRVRAQTESSPQPMEIASGDMTYL